MESITYELEHPALDAAVVMQLSRQEPTLEVLADEAVSVPDGAWTSLTLALERAMATAREIIDLLMMSILRVGGWLEGLVGL